MPAGPSAPFGTTVYCNETKHLFSAPSLRANRLTMMEESDF
jgi:hypothetical protein